MSQRGSSALLVGVEPAESRENCRRFCVKKIEPCDFARLESKSSESLVKNYSLGLVEL